MTGSALSVVFGGASMFGERSGSRLPSPGWRRVRRRKRTSERGAESMTLPDDGVQTPRAPDGIRCAGGLLIASSAVGARHTLQLHGELDLASAAELVASAGLLVSDATEIVLDLSG